MRIAQIAPLSESVPPHRYGGTERVVSYLTEELVRRGHDVTLFASGDSETRARLVSVCPKALWRSDEYVLQDVYHMLLLERVFREADRFDVMHFHYDYWHLPLANRQHVPFLMTLHGRLDLPDLVPVYEAFPNAPVVSISDAQRRPLPWLNWLRTIHHGLPADMLALNENPDEYLAFVGRTSPEKGLDRAIRIAIEAGMKLKIGAAVQPANRDYFEREIHPLLDHPLIEFVGEIGGPEKQEFIGNAYALLFPIEWPEPFGLVMIEAMACGTPVVAFARGSVPEVMWDGVSGYIVEDVAQAVEAVGKIASLDRRRVRRCFEERFTVERMVDQYVNAHVRLLADRRPRNLRSLVAGRRRRPSSLRGVLRAHSAPPDLDLRTDGVMPHTHAGTAEAAEE